MMSSMLNYLLALCVRTLGWDVLTHPFLISLLKVKMIFDEIIYLDS